jgi:hypothetical protein
MFSVSFLKTPLEHQVDLTYNIQKALYQFQSELKYSFFSA